MKTIWKFPLVVTDSQSIEMPEGAAILCVQTQYDRPCIWALCDPKNRTEERVFRMYGTGHRYAEQDNYIGTVQTDDGSLVWHVFEVEP